MKMLRFVGISAGSVGSEPKQSSGIANFVQAARALQQQLLHHLDPTS